MIILTEEQVNFARKRKAMQKNGPLKIILILEY